ncbi:uncharacterized protein LOC143376097 isoform X2 [Andrena cerasifolii]|uniref:uncharacterized protein LOC143376097 isoform X2 n=1 Tax=Andrena cerasifolii TaxID=2819439 RepID=UPI004037BA74
MSDLVTNLLTQYYGFGAESSGKKFLSIHQSVENAKEEDEQVTEQNSLSTSEENPSEEESKKDNDDCRKLSAASESYPRSSRVLEDTEYAHDFTENLDSFDFDLGPNIICDFVKDTEQIMINQQSSNFPRGGVKSTLETPGAEANSSKMANGSDLSLTFVEDDSPESASDVSSSILKKSQKSSKTSTPLPPMPRKRPVYNDTFADLSNANLEQFPSEILERFSGLKMLYLADNRLTELPNEVFSSLRGLEWLDVRSNQLSSLPSSIESHPCLQTLLLQGNKIERLPLELCTLAKLKTLLVTQNPLATPPRDIVAAGYSAILEFLRTEWNIVHPERQVEFKQNKIEPKLSTILCYQSPRRKKRNAGPKNTVRDRNASNREKRKSYKPSNRCENRGANVSMEHRLLWFSKVKELFAKQASMLQKMKDECVLKEWKRDKRSFSKAMEKAMRRNGDDIPFGFDVEDYASVFKQKPRSENSRARKRSGQKFIPPDDINKRISELLDSLSQLQMETVDERTPRTQQHSLENQVEKILQFQSEIQNLRKYNDVAPLPLKN